MTKREHMVEVELDDIDEDILEVYDVIHEKLGMPISAFLENYADAIKYGWEPYLEETMIKKLFSWRLFLKNEIIKLDEKIDELIEPEED